MAKVSEEQASRPDEENPEWTAEDIRTARPAREVLPLYIGQAATQELMRRGKTTYQTTKEGDQPLHIDADVLDAYRSEGEGWQMRVNEVLREHMPKRTA